MAYDSSDDNYEAVNDISDSEEDEADVTKVEERAIQDSEQDDGDEQETPRPTQEDEEESWEGFDDNSQSVLGDDVPFFDAQMAHTEEPEFDTATWAAASSLASDDERLVRKVRFDLSDSDDEEEEDNYFPDIFVPQSELASSFRRQIEQDHGSEDSFWDHSERTTLPVEEDNDSRSDSSSSSSISYDCMLLDTWLWSMLMFLYSRR